MFNLGINLATAGDPDIQPYADNYFEYDPSSHAVTKEVASVCESCPGGGTTTDLFYYSSNSHYPGDGFNTWDVKTEQILPDGSKIVVYTNYAGLAMLKSEHRLQRREHVWGTFFFSTPMDRRFGKPAPPLSICLRAYPRWS